MAKQTKPVNQAENSAPLVDDEVIDQSLTAEQRAFKKSQKQGYDPNHLENPHASSMSVKDAQKIVKSYEGVKLAETPNDLKRAKEVLKNQK